MYRKILVPLDGSATSLRGLREAVGIAKAHGARLRILNVFDERLFVSMAEGYPMSNIEVLTAELRAEGQKSLETASKAARNRA